MLTPAVIQRITSTYASYPHDDIELEARFGSFDLAGKFTSGIKRRAFTRIQEFIVKNKARPVTTQSTDFIKGDVRKSVITPLGQGPSETIWIRKIKLMQEPIVEYGIRISMSREIQVQPIEPFVPEVIRVKNRTSFILFNGAVRVDLTIADTSPLTGISRSNNSTQYEVEIELLKSKNEPLKLTQFSSAIRSFLFIIQETIVLYNQKQKREIINYFNWLLRSPNRDELDNNMLIQARNLKLKDMVYGGLIGNPKTGYSVTHKADGMRKLLLFARDGIWLVSPPDDIMYVSTGETQWTGTILEGELVDPARRNPQNGAPKSPLWFLGFDCLAYRDSSDVQQQPHGVRCNYLLEIAEQIKTDLLFVTAKKFRAFTTPQEFNRVLNEMLNEQAQLPYQQDGLMFTPTSVEYLPRKNSKNQAGASRGTGRRDVTTDRSMPIHRLPLRERHLSRYPDICKFKPKEFLTIDFKIKWVAEETTRKIELYSNVKGQAQLFVGSDINPLNPEAIDVTNPITVHVPTDTIVEYGWDYQTNKLVPHRIRHEKPQPNRMEVALDIWDDIHHPIEAATLRGEDQVLLRRYHNRIKRGLFEAVGNNKTLLDIGSGRGGDVAKWLRFDRVVAVEPNVEYIPELERRIALHGLQDRVRIVVTGGEDTDTIIQAVQEFIGGPVDVVAMMLSMTFFWQSEPMVQALADTIGNTLKPNGQFIFLTMDGDLVEQTFNPTFQTGPYIKQLQLGTVSMQYDGALQQVSIHIPDSIVQDQIEWLVRLDDLRIRLQPYNLGLTEVHRADQEKFMSEAELTLSQMYTYGIFSYVQGEDIEGVVEEEVEEEVEGIQPLEEDAVEAIEPSVGGVQLFRIGTFDSSDLTNSFYHSVLKAISTIYQETEDVEVKRQLAAELQAELPSIQITPMKQLSQGLGLNIYLGHLEPGLVMDTLQELTGNRRTIILLQLETKYEVVGLLNDDIIQTVFEATDPLLQLLV